MYIQCTGRSLKLQCQERNIARADTSFLVESEVKFGISESKTPTNEFPLNNEPNDFAKRKFKWTHLDHSGFTN